ncbi:hypothetical protein [Amycolatopsis palatopharyngis]|uniref:hypothetical protein n=1 Tax=Amycolatopsis palatopharyngis TaxID=187982 RepID=UPI0013BEA954|nr:hypothetical protein [Amycolatopsis palatopharyngis]
MSQNDTGGGLTMHRGRDLSAEERHKAARYVASEAYNAYDCADLLSMLGLNAAEGLDR